MSAPEIPAEPIRVKDVYRSFGDVVAIDGVTMTVPQGALVGLIGPSGSGKTTLVRMLTGAAMFFSGFILPVEEFREPVRYVAYAMPVTYAVALFQDQMLRGGGGTPAWSRARSSPSGWSCSCLRRFGSARRCARQRSKPG